MESSEVLGAVEEDVKNVLNNLLAFFPTRRFAGRSTDFAELDRARGTLLTRFVNAATTDGTQLRIDPVQKRLNSVIKQLIWYHVIDDSPTKRTFRRDSVESCGRYLKRYVDRQKKHSRSVSPAVLTTEACDAYRTGFEARCRWPCSRKLAAGGSTKAQRVHRGLLDYIAGLSDAEADYEHSVLKGREVVGHL